jgi:D-methionine transport system ATP-binding protein
LSEHIISLQGVTKEFDTKGGKVVALRDIDLNIEKGDSYGIIGLSGAGKSTLVRTINLLEEPTEGKVLFDGKLLTGLSPKELNLERRRISMIFQQFNLLMQRDATGNICFPLEIAGVPKAEAVEKAKELLKVVDLEERANSYPSQLSGGQKQRVAIARALASDPEVILCDEATSALDPKTTNSILELLMEINQKLGITVIIVTHQMEVVRKACSKACILENGRITAEGSVRDIFFNQPESLLKLLGEEDVKLPAEGHNIQITHLLNDLSDGELFGRMYEELKIVFPIINGTIQEYENDHMGIFTINVKDKDLAVVTGYLDDHGIRWKEIAAADDSDDEERLEEE